MYLLELKMEWLISLNLILFIVFILDIEKLNGFNSNKPVLIKTKVNDIY